MAGLLEMLMSPQVNPAMVDQLATDPFNPQMGLLQRLLPMLQQMPPGPGFGAPPSDMSSAQRPQQPSPQMTPQAAPMAAGGPPMDLATIMQSQGSTNPLPYPMADGSRPPASGQRSPSLAAPAPAQSPMSGGGISGLMGGFGNFLQQNSLPLMMLGAGIAGGRGWGDGISKGLAGAAGVMQKTGEQRQKLGMQQQAFQMLVAQGVPPQKAMLAVMAPEAGKAAGVLGGSSSETEDIKNYNAAKAGGFKGSFMDYLGAKRGGAGEYGLQPIWGTDAEGNPAIVQLGKNSEAAQARMPPGFRPAKDPIKIDAGTEWILLDPQTRQPIGRIPKDVAGKEKAEAIGKSQGTAEQSIPGVETTVNNAVGVIGKLRTHPGLSAGTGATGTVARQIPGTAAYDFGALNKQAQGQAFMAAREALKGAGQVTDFEGSKGEQAIANLDAAQSKEQYLAALDTLERMMKASLSDLKKKAGQPAQEQPQDDGGGWTTLPNGIRIREKR